MIRRLMEHIPEFLVILFVAGLIGLGVVAALNRKTIGVPVEYCQQHTTGRTRERAETTYNCFSYDSKTGVCTNSVPITNYYTDHEVRVICEFTEWK